MIYGHCEDRQFYPRFNWRNLLLFTPNFSFRVAYMSTLVTVRPNSSTSINFRREVMEAVVGRVLLITILSTLNYSLRILHQRERARTRIDNNALGLGNWLHERLFK